jgi:flagellin
MSLSVLNNIPSLVSQNNLAVTNENLHSTLLQLSSGSRINSGADNPAGLSIVNGLQANISALQQSSQNATAGVGQLQVADGALSQVTSLLNRAVTLATQAANGGLTAAQFTAVTNEYGSIASEINRIGQATNFNGTQVFSAANAASANQLATTATVSLNLNTSLTSGQTTSVQLGNNAAYTFTAGSQPTNIYTSGTGSLTANSAVTALQTLAVTNTSGSNTFTAAALHIGGGTAGLVAATSALTAGDALTVTNGLGSATYSFTAGDKLGALIGAINTTGAASGISASLTAGGALQITGTAAGGNLTFTQSAANITDVGTMTATANLGDFMNQIDSSAAGLTATLNTAGNMVVTSTKGNITSVTNNLTAIGTLTATNTVQDLINGINASGLGVTASLATVTDANKVVSTNGSLNGGLAITAGGTLTINSGVAVNGVSPNTFTYTASATTPDTVAGTAGNNSIQGFIDAVNTSGTSFHAFIDGNSKLEITDSSYSGNMSTTGTLAGAGATGLMISGGAVQQLEITDPSNRANLGVQSNDAALGFVSNVGGNPLKGGNADAFVATPTTTGASGASVFVSDGQVTGALNNTIKVAVGALSTTQIGTNVTTLASQNLSTAASAATALTVINTAISNVAAMRGTIGAGINRLNSATNVINTQVQNLTSAQSSIQDADIGQVVANMSKYQVLEQTGISALSQSNQNAQAVLKLLQ